MLTSVSCIRWIVTTLPPKSVIHQDDTSEALRAGVSHSSHILRGSSADQSGSPEEPEILP